MVRCWPLLLLLGSCSGQPAVAPGGIVSNNPCIDSVLAEIAAPNQISAVSVYSHDADSASAPLAWARQFPALGTGAEDVMAAKPRLVLTGNLASSGTNAALAKAGIPIVAIGVAASIDEDVTQVRQIAKAIGRVKAGEALVARMLAALPDADQSTVTDDAPSAIIWQNGGFVAGKDTLQDDLLRRHGFRNASVDFGLKAWGVLPLEMLIRNPPRIIFTPVNAKGNEARELTSRLRLLKHLGNQTLIVPFHDRLLYCGGPNIIKISNIFQNARRSLQ
ncbi:ABC transporter substrate-binding protein [Sphingorhabdus sp. IMCC26285]|jgi:iron complex transport system substrate-binding protein|uniref:ABC transporter substrate-binding protein n=1 Tax=Sphingorhabdus profundilacus TaxID=2509718 RepID=A0A6I4LW36_9SPHN|nr:ABC transporter substrate-binding protein [Sphingorhabdus profundilacus]MVZ96340.1 ABC transporter substrate-binding protein [Sphingorhabdus profundilacus]